MGKISKQRLALIVASALGALSIFMPWASIWGLSANGTDTSVGWLALALFAGVIILSIRGNISEPLGKLKFAAAAGLVNLLIGITNIIDVIKYAGFGLYLLILMSACVAVAPFIKKLD